MREFPRPQARDPEKAFFSVCKYSQSDDWICDWSELSLTKYIRSLLHIGENNIASISATTQHTDH